MLNINYLLIYSLFVYDEAASSIVVGRSGVRSRSAVSKLAAREKKKAESGMTETDKIQRTALFKGGSILFSWQSRMTSPNGRKGVLVVRIFKIRQALVVQSTSNNISTAQPF